jgi:hypothetical protein
MQVHGHLLAALPRPVLPARDRPYPLNRELQIHRASLDGLERRNHSPLRALGPRSSDCPASNLVLLPAALARFGSQTWYQVTRDSQVNARNLLMACHMSLATSFSTLLHLFPPPPQQLLNWFSSPMQFKDPLLSSQNSLSWATLSHPQDTFCYHKSAVSLEFATFHYILHAIMLYSAGLCFHVSG